MSTSPTYRFSINYHPFYFLSPAPWCGIAIHFKICLFLLLLLYRGCTTATIAELRIVGTPGLWIVVTLELQIATRTWRNHGAVNAAKAERVGESNGCELQNPGAAHLANHAEGGFRGFSGFLEYF